MKTAFVVALALCFAVGASDAMALTQREQQEAAQRAYEASADTYNEVNRDAKHLQDDTAKVIGGAAAGAATGGAVGAAAGAAGAAVENSLDNDD